jgi:polysaccharide biosynthesis transport protein
LHFMQDELAKAEGVFAVLSERILRLTTEQRAPDQVRLLRPAEKAVVPVADAPYIGIALASLLFFVPFGLAGTWEYLVRRVSSIQQLEESAYVTVIGEVARLPVRTRVSRNGSKARVDRGLTVFEESIDGLRTNLMLSEELMGMKVLAVTSAAEDEGKTSVAAQLAVNMAWVSGKRTLLIDGDMRSPDIYNVFDISNEPGLAEILTKDCSVEDAIVRNEKNYTDVLPAGKLHTNPHRILGNGAMKSFMEEVRSKYDHIIIDTPPILAASEALVLARVADRSLMCAMKDSSRIDQVKKAHERLTLAGGQPIGIVLNGVPTSHYLHRYGAYAYSRD